MWAIIAAFNDENKEVSLTNDYQPILCRLGILFWSMPWELPHENHRGNERLLWVYNWAKLDKIIH